MSRIGKKPVKIPAGVEVSVNGDLVEFKKSEGTIEEDMEVLKIKKIDLPEDERRNIILNVVGKK